MISMDVEVQRSSPEKQPTLLRQLQGLGGCLIASKQYEELAISFLQRIRLCESNRQHKNGGLIMQLQLISSSKLKV